MRTLYVFAVGFVMTVTLAPAVVIARLLGAPDGPNSFYQRCMSLWARSLCAAAGVRIRVHGGEHIARDRGVIYVSNHVSWFDIFVIASVLPSYSFVAKSELRRIPIFGRGAEAAGIVFLDRDNQRAAFESYKLAAKEVEKGRSIVVCPEGTRGFDYPLRPFKKGPFVLAIAAQAPIVPTLVHGAREVMRKGSFRIRSADVDLHFYPPVATAGLSYDDRAKLMTRVWTLIADEMREMYGVGTKEYPIALEKERRAR